MKCLLDGPNTDIFYILIYFKQITLLSKFIESLNIESQNAEQISWPFIYSFKLKWENKTRFFFFKERHKCDCQSYGKLQKERNNWMMPQALNVVFSSNHSWNDLYDFICYQAWKLLIAFEWKNFKISCMIGHLMQIF